MNKLSRNLSQNDLSFVAADLQKIVMPYDEHIEEPSLIGVYYFFLIKTKACRGEQSNGDRLDLS